MYFWVQQPGSGDRSSAGPQDWQWRYREWASLFTFPVSPPKRLTQITIHSLPQNKKANMKTASHPLAAMLTFAGRAGRAMWWLEDALWYGALSFLKGLPVVTRYLKAGSCPQALSRSRGPDQSRHKVPDSSPFHLITVSTHPLLFWIIHQPEILSWKLENLVLDNSVLWIPQITNLSVQMFI